MRTAADSNVLVAALLRDHPHHGRAAPVLREARSGERALVVAAHALAEAFATLTALPVSPRVTTAEAARMMGDVASVAEVVALDGADYAAVLDRMARLDLSSGAVYDALHVRAAEKAGAEELLTFNGAHFRRMPPEPPCRLVVL